MPRVKLLLNLGRDDAKKFGLDPKKALAGESVDVSDEAADEMLRKGWATDKPDESRPAPEAQPHNSAGLPSGPAPKPEPGKAPEPAPVLAPAPEKRVDRK